MSLTAEIDRRLDRLAEVLPPPADPLLLPGDDDWDDAEVRLGNHIPENIRRFHARYGHGQVYAITDEQDWVYDWSTDIPSAGAAFETGIAFAYVEFWKDSLDFTHFNISPELHDLIFRSTPILIAITIDGDFLFQVRISATDYRCLIWRRDIGKFHNRIYDADFIDFLRSYVLGELDYHAYNIKDRQSRYQFKPRFSGCRHAQRRDADHGLRRLLPAWLKRRIGE